MPNAHLNELLKSDTHAKWHASKQRRNWYEKIQG